MNWFRWVLVTVFVLGGVGLQGRGLAEERVAPQSELSEWKVRPLANAHLELYRSSDPQRIFCGSPGLARCPNGRIVATYGLLARDGATLDGPTWNNTTWGGRHRDGFRQGKLCTSDDHGKTWTERVTFPFIHGRPIVAGESLYVLGHADDLMVIRSDDWGETWSEPSQLTDGQIWHQAPSNVHTANGNVYLVMERRIGMELATWAVGELAPVLLRGKIGTDLLKRENWTFASALTFHEAIDDRKLDMFGVPFYPVFFPQDGYPAKGVKCVPMGWLETNVVQFTDPNHYWYDETGRTFHLWMRAHTGGTNLAAIAKVVENDDGTMTTMLEKVPSGKKAAFIPCPGGHMKFHIVYDDVTARYWLLSTQATDSMTRVDRLPEGRYNLPNNERRRLQLHFSKNCVDWCFAGLVAVGPAEHASRHYASMVIDGDDLHMLSRSGDEQAQNAHNGNIITFHTIKNFRRLVY